MAGMTVTLERSLLHGGRACCLFDDTQHEICLKLNLYLPPPLLRASSLSVGLQEFSPAPRLRPDIMRATKLDAAGALVPSEVPRW